MTRIAGTPEEKLALLARIDQKTLPHLVGDVLFFLRNHKDVKVVDGPGDGKRDVHSVTPNDTRHITQCKYHQNTSASVSTDETDELVLALNKFGYKTGLFVTTGKISPQAKREYLDNYPDFQLDFLDGINLVETVLSSPVLSAVWFDGTEISKLRNALSIPFIIRRSKDDHPIRSEQFGTQTFTEITHKYELASCETRDLDPYRAPVDRTYSEHSPKFIQGHRVVCSGKVYIYNITEHIKLITQHIASMVNAEDLPVVIRFGKPAFIPHNESTDEDAVKINSEETDTCSFVIDTKRQVVPENEWIVFQSRENWFFPKNFSVTQAEWAGWINRKTNTILMQELSWADNEEPFFEQQFNRLKKRYLEQSLFLVGSSTEKINLLEKLPEKYYPEWECEYGPNGIMLGWLHPALSALEGGVVFSVDPEKGDFTGKLTTDIDDLAFEETKKLARQTGSQNGFSVVDFSQAKLIAAIAGEDFLPDKKTSTTFSAELYHYFNDIPSPIFTADRKLLFVRMWQIDEDPQQIDEQLQEKPVTLISKNLTKLYWDARIGSTNNKTFLMSSLIFSPPPEISTNEFFSQIEQEAEDCLQQLAEYIRSLWKAELATIFFWQTELGFRMSDQEITGNPWIITSKPKESQ